MSVNKVILIGNVGKAPEIRYIENTTKVAQLTLATTERYKGKDGQIKENTEWHNLVAWRATADIIEKYVQKGSQIYIEGKLRSRSYTDASGVKKYITEVMVETLQLLGRREAGSGDQRSQAQIYPERNEQEEKPVQLDIPQDDGKDDLPF